MEKSGAGWKLLSYSGTPVFGLAATSAIDNPSGGGIVATSDGGAATETQPLPVRTGQVLNDHYSDGSVFSFVSGQSFSLWSNPGAYHDMEYKTDLPAVVSAPVSPGQIYDCGAVSLESVTTAPALFSGDNEPAATGHTYVVKCANGNYAKFRITDKTATNITFDWAYQPDGTKDIK
jgi:hypothetical protein